MTATVAEPAGEHCANGGVAVESGIDDNNNGVLDAGEVEHVDYVCDAGDTPTLVRQDPIGPGAVCPAGGTLVKSGRDLNHDGVLEDSEVESTVTVCDALQIWNGDVRTSQWTAEALAKLRVIVGTLTIDSDASMPALELVTGDVLATASTIDLPALQQIVGGFTESGVSTASVALPLLTRVGGGFGLTMTAAHATLAAPMLTSVGGDVVLGVGIDGATVDLSHLQDVGGGVEYSAALASAPMPALAHVGRAVTLSDDVAGVFQQPALATIGGTFRIDAAAVTTVDVPMLTSIGGDAIASGSALATLRMPALATVAGALQATAAPLTTLELPALQSTGGELSIYASQLTALSLPSLSHLGGTLVSTGTYGTDSLALYQNPHLATLAVPMLATADADVLIKNNDQLAVVELPQLTTAHGVFVLESAGVTEVRVPQLARAVGVGLGNVPKLTVVEFSKLTAIDDRLQIVGASALPDLTGFDAIASAGTVDLEGLDTLVNLHGLEALQSARDLLIEFNEKLVTLHGADRLGSIAGQFTVTHSAALQSASLGDLRYVGGNVSIDHNPALASLGGVQHIASIGGDLAITENTALAALGLDDLASLTGTLTIQSNSALPQAQIDSLRARLGK